MSRRATLNALLSLLLSTAALGGPVAAANASGGGSSGGASLGGSPSSPGTSSSSPGTTSTASPGGSETAPSPGTTSSPSVGSANVTVSANGGGFSFSTHSSAMLSSEMTFTGTVSRVRRGQVVEIERLGSETGWQWAPTVHATPASNGTFRAVWQTNHIGQFSIRAVLVSASAAAQESAMTPSSSSPAVTVIVYRPSIATLYGPGFYGKKTACGEVLSQATIGLANKSLPCGTKVALEYDGHTLVVPVIDRGPYANDADWDLTMATGKALGITGTERIGAVSLRTR